MKKNIVLQVAAFCCSLLMLCITGSTSYAAEETVIASTVLGDPNYVNAGWMNHRVYITGYGINCSMGIGEMAQYPVQIKQVGNERMCVLQDTRLVDIFISNMNHDLAALAVTNRQDLFRRGNTYVSADSSSTIQIAPGTKNWLLGILHKRLMGKPEDIHLTLDESLIVRSTGTQNMSYSDNYVLSGTCTTSFKTSGTNRSTNIDVAASRMNMVIMPGQAVSVSDTFLPRTAANGYKVAHAYSGGKIIDSLGGGICQVSSTIYNACRNSGLEILARFPHSMPVSYLPLGMDAAISAGSKDLVFRNPYNVPVIMQASTQNKQLTVNVLVPSDTLAGTTYKFWAQKTGPLSADSYVTTYVNGLEQSTVCVGTSKYRPLPAE